MPKIKDKELHDDRKLSVNSVLSFAGFVAAKTSDTLRWFGTKTFTTLTSFTRREQKFTQRQPQSSQDYLPTVQTSVADTLRYAVTIVATGSFAYYNPSLAFGLFATLKLMPQTAINSLYRKLLNNDKQAVAKAISIQNDMANALTFSLLTTTIFEYTPAKGLPFLVYGEAKNSQLFLSCPPGNLTSQLSVFTAPAESFLEIATNSLLKTAPISTFFVGAVAQEIDRRKKYETLDVVTVYPPKSLDFKICSVTPYCSSCWNGASKIIAHNTPSTIAIGEWVRGGLDGCFIQNPIQYSFDATAKVVTYSTAYRPRAIQYTLNLYPGWTCNINPDGISLSCNDGIFPPSPIPIPAPIEVPAPVEVPTPGFIFPSLVINGSLSRQFAKVDYKFNFMIPNTTFIDSQGRAVKVTALGMPDWLLFDDIKWLFHGEPLPLDANYFFDKNTVIYLRATNGYDIVNTSFDLITVRWDTPAQMLIGLSVVSALIGLGCGLNSCLRIIRGRKNQDGDNSLVHPLEVPLMAIAASIQDGDEITRDQAYDIMRRYRTFLNKIHTIKMTLRSMFLVEFCCHNTDTIGGFLLSGTIFLGFIRGVLKAIEPLISAYMLDLITDVNDATSNERVIEYLRNWVICIGMIYVVGELNGLLVAGVQKKLFDKLVQEKFLRKIYDINLYDMEKSVLYEDSSKVAIALEDQCNNLASGVKNFIPAITEAAFVLGFLWSNNSFFNDVQIKNAQVYAISLYTFINVALNVGHALYSKNTYEKLLNERKKFTSVIQEDFKAMQTIRMYNRQAPHRQHMQKLSEKLAIATRNDQFWKSLPRAVINFLLLGTSLYTGYSIRGMNFDKNDLDKIVLAIRYLILVTKAGEVIGERIISCRRGDEGLENIYKFLKSTDEIVNVQQPTAMVPLQLPAVLPVIEFRNVNLWLGELPNRKHVLQNVSFTINRGETVAFVGESGSGKSTIIKLICGFYRHNGKSVVLGPDSEILINGQNINTMNINGLRQNITLVNQELEMFSKPDEHIDARLAYNILYGHIDDPELLQQVKQGELRPEPAELTPPLVPVRGMSNFLRDVFQLGNTMPDLRKPSGGEKQRIGFARGCRCKQITILDEPTSALDAITESELIRSINTFMQWQHTTPDDRVLILIGHRLKTVNRANKIIVMRNGRISADGIGTHQVLMARQGDYFEYYNAQEQTPSFSLTDRSQALDQALPQYGRVQQLHVLMYPGVATPITAPQQQQPDLLPKGAEEAAQHNHQAAPA